VDVRAREQPERDDPHLEVAFDEDLRRQIATHALEVGGFDGHGSGALLRARWCFGAQGVTSNGNRVDVRSTPHARCARDQPAGITLSLAFRVERPECVRAGPA
jgi:hypothetical protein